MSRANKYTWEDLGQVVGPQGPAGPAGGGSVAEKKDFSGGSYDPLSGQYTNKTKDQILNEVYTETDNGTNPKEYYGGISGVGDEAVKQLFGVNDVAPNSMTYVDYHKDVKFDGKATSYENLPYTNTFLFAVISGKNTTIYDSSDKTKRQCVVINGTVTASKTTMQELVVGAGGVTITLKDGENSTIPYVINGETSQSGVVTLNEGDIIHIKEYSHESNYYNNAYQNVPYFMSTDTNCIHDYLSDGLFAAPSGEQGAISHVMVMAGSGMIEYTKANYSYQKEYKFTCRYSDPNYNQKCVEATYGYATWDNTIQADKLNPVKNDMPENYTVLNFDYTNETGDLMLKLVGDIANYDNVCGYVELPSGELNTIYKEYLYGDANELLHFYGDGNISVNGTYIHYKKYKVLKDTILEIIFVPYNNDYSLNPNPSWNINPITRKFYIVTGNIPIKRVDENYIVKPQFKSFELTSNLSNSDIIDKIFKGWNLAGIHYSYRHIFGTLSIETTGSSIYKICHEMKLTYCKDEKNTPVSVPGNPWRIENDFASKRFQSFALYSGGVIEGSYIYYDDISRNLIYNEIDSLSQIRFVESRYVPSGTINLCMF